MEENIKEQTFGRNSITLTTWDIVAIVAYFAIILTVGLSVSCFYYCVITFTI